ncbi:MAG: response regulator [Nitrospina sp.]|nr:response regulator [Nitrospina sp.]
MTFRLLVADDSITIQKIVSMAFEVEDAEVEGIGDGQEALDRISQFKPDIVLADVDMPGLDGFELSAKIKESPETSAIKVLLLASDFEEFDEQRYQSCGADNHISKPFKSDDIVAMVKSLLETSGEETAPLAAVDLVETEDELAGLEPNEEPSLEELLASVEELSTEGLSGVEDEAIELTDEESTEGFSDAEDKAIELTDEESMELMANIRPMGSPESPEPVELSAEDEVLEEAQPLAVDDETVALTDEELVEPMELSEVPEPLEDAGLEPETELADDDIMDQMIRGVEELKESVQAPDAPEVEAFPFEGEEFGSERPQALAFTEEPEIFAEIRPRKLDNLDELDSTFKEIVTGGGPAHHEKPVHPAELSSLGGIVPEPEDLLERIAPGAFTEVGKRPATPEDIKENLDAISGFADQNQDVNSLHYDLSSENWGHETGSPFTQAIADEVRQLLQRSLGSSLEKEVSGLSEVILRTVREVVREITPEIARRVIREEIEKIKKQDMY